MGRIGKGGGVGGLAVERLLEVVQRRPCVAALQRDRSQAEVRGVRVFSEVLADGLVVTANPEKVQRVLFNLIQNAIRHTPADGSITVRASATDEGVMVEVADDGAGIPLDDRPHVFEPFFRGGADESRTTEGAGLGLAVSRAIVEAHGGEIWLEPTASGTEMRFTLLTTAAA
mgnify:CR=1 FL=1